MAASCFVAPTLVQHKNVIESDVFYVMTRNAGYQRGWWEALLKTATLLMSTRRNSPTAVPSGRASGLPRRRKKGTSDDVPHGDVGDGDIFEDRAVHRLERDSPTLFQHAVGDG